MADTSTKQEIPFVSAFQSTVGSFLPLRVTSNHTSHALWMGACAIGARILGDNKRAQIYAETAYQRMTFDIPTYDNIQSLIVIAIFLSLVGERSRASIYIVHANTLLLVLDTDGTLLNLSLCIEHLASASLNVRPRYDMDDPNLRRLHLVNLLLSNLLAGCGSHHEADLITTGDSPQTEALVAELESNLSSSQSATSIIIASILCGLVRIAQLDLFELSEQGATDHMHGNGMTQGAVEMLKRGADYIICSPSVLRSFPLVAQLAHGAAIALLSLPQEEEMHRRLLLALQSEEEYVALCGCGCKVPRQASEQADYAWLMLPCLGTGVASRICSVTKYITYMAQANRTALDMSIFDEHTSEGSVHGAVHTVEEVFHQGAVDTARYGNSVQTCSFPTGPEEDCFDTYHSTGDDPVGFPSNVVAKSQARKDSAAT
jgi:hypothetical protein